MLRYLTAGESHGKLLTTILEGIPVGLDLVEEDINRELARRQKGYGRGKRMEIEKDEVEITSGVRLGKTLGSPITLLIKNRDWENWKKLMSVRPLDKGEVEQFNRPRPGHADLAGALKYNQKDIRNVLERSSARETTSRVAAGAVVKKFLSEFGIQVMSYVVEVGGIKAEVPDLPLGEIFAWAEDSELHCPDKIAEMKMKDKIDEARNRGNTVGGIFEVIVTGVPPGLGSFMQWDLKLDGRIAWAVMSIQAIKGVEIGLGFEVARLSGSQVHDEIFYDHSRSRFFHKTNRAGGIEGGMSNGENIIIRAAMKPIATLYSPLQSINMVSKEPELATVERSDICRVPSASVIAEAAVAIEIGRALLEKFGGDSLDEIKRNYQGYCTQLDNF
jgi:chorismate synthase